MLFVGKIFKIRTIILSFKSTLGRSKGLLVSSLFSAVLLSACGGGGGGGTPAATYQITGTISPTSGSRIDSDVNDPAYAFAANDTINAAQLLPNPVILGGFVSTSGSGLSGSRFELFGDTKDFFHVQLLEGQVINLNLANVSSNLDLFLYNAIGNPILSSTSGIGLNESITVPGSFTGARDYFVEVRAIAGVSNYTLTTGISISSVSSSELEQDFVPGEVIVKFKDNLLPSGVSIDSLSMRAESVSMKAVAGAPGRDMLMRLGDGKQVASMKQALGIAQNVQVQDATLQQKIDTINTMKALSQRNDVESARLNYIYQPMATPDDPLYVSQWHYPLINLPQAWDITQGSDSVIVAVVDTGVLLNHPDFVNADTSSQLVPGFDFIRDADVAADNESDSIVGDIDSNPNDPGDQAFGFSSSFHGTHVAGTVGASTNNGEGVAGVAWNVKVMPIRALGVGGGTTYDIEQAILFASGLPNDSGTVPAQKADVINLSLGGTGGAGPTPSAYLQARAAGTIIVAAAGNESFDVPIYPASYDDAVVSVSAVDLGKNRAFYSNFGSHVDVAGPGGDSSQNLNGDSFPDGVVSILGSDASSPLAFTYGLKQGTSMATPHIAGIAALMKSVHSGLTPTEFENALQSGTITEDLGATGRDDLFGHGLIDALGAVLTAQVLNAGGVLPDNPFMAVSPGSLNFGTSGISAKLNVRNTGSGATPLTITSVTNDSGGWLTHVAPSGGLGDYSFVANRSGLADNSTYSATITIVSSVNTVTIPVIMQKATVPTTDDAGRHYMLLYQVNGATASQQDSANAFNGSYNFGFSDVAEGEYYIIAGTDLNNDGFICNAGEACGIYPDSTPDSRTFTLSGDVNNADFISGFASGQSASALSASSPIKIPSKGFQVKSLQP